MKISRLLVLILATGTFAARLSAQDFKREVIYQIVTDRFFDGDPNNNCPPYDQPDCSLYDPNRENGNWQKYWGGDFAGIQQKMDYLAGMGVTAIWISPPVDNINVLAGSSAPYHGYSARDMKAIEEHFGDPDPATSWQVFGQTVQAAHAAGIKVIVDFAPNHSNLRASAEFGILYDQGTLLATYSPEQDACANDDPNLNNCFHHTLVIGDYNNRYQDQYYTLSGLADINQENPVMDQYLKQAVRLLQQHGVDAFRIDALKHTTHNWLYTLANTIYSNGPSFVFGEWYEGFGDALYRDSRKLANHSGMSILDYPLAFTTRDVFGNNNRSFQNIENALSRESHDFARPNDLVTFFDNHDLPRLTTLNRGLGDDANKRRLNQALAFLLTCRGLPIIYYGDEQYLHNDTNNGNDPYNRLRMTSWDTTTPAYQLIGTLSQLRQTNPALAYGTHLQRWILQDAYIYERQFFDSIVVIAINKGTAPVDIPRMHTNLPLGDHDDYLGGALDGFSVRVVPEDDGTGRHRVEDFVMSPHSVAIWQVTAPPAQPQVGSIGPAVGQSGMVVTLAGQGFGPGAGSVWFNDTFSATIQSWSDSQITFVVPNVNNGNYQVRVVDCLGNMGNTVDFKVLTNNLIPVTFKVNNAPSLVSGENIFLSGNTIELGQWSSTWDETLGPAVRAPSDPPNDYFLNVAAPAGTDLRFKFMKMASDGTVTWENGANHSYTVPASGVGVVTVDWQN